MSISLTEDATIAVCEVCGTTESTTKPDGVVPANWMTGQLWIDASLAEQFQRPLCFCPTCKGGVPDRLAFSVLPAPEVIHDPAPVEPTEPAPEQTVPVTEPEP